jgi:phospholipid-transporting ATPase
VLRLTILFSDEPQLPEDVLPNVVPHRSGDTEIQLVRFQKAIKKVRATQRMRRQRGFAFSQTETNNQDQTRLIRAYDTSVARPTGY